MSDKFNPLTKDLVSETAMLCPLCNTTDTEIMEDDDFWCFNCKCAHSLLDGRAVNIKHLRYVVMGCMNDLFNEKHFTRFEQKIAQQKIKEWFPVFFEEEKRSSSDEY